MMNETMCVKTKLCACSLGVALGVTKGLFMIYYAWMAAYSGYGVEVVNAFSTMFHGYAPTLIGGLFGGLWGLVDGFIFGVIAAWIYNYCIGRCCNKKSCEPKVSKM